jgi:hypothetical protein
MCGRSACFKRLILWCVICTVKIVEILAVHIVSMEQGYLSQYGVWLRTDGPGDRGSIPGSEAHPASCPMDTGGPFPGVKRGRCVTLTTHPYLVPRPWMSRSYSSSPPSLPYMRFGFCFLFYVDRKIRVFYLQKSMFFRLLNWVYWNWWCHSTDTTSHLWAYS